jgi:hypothetical protein
MKVKALLLIGISCCLTGCVTWPWKKKPPLVVSPAMSPETARAFDEQAAFARLQKELEEKFKAFMSKVASSVDATTFAITLIQESLPKHAAFLENKQTQTLIKDVERKPEDKAEAMERVNLVLQNNLIEANKRYEQAMTEADLLRAEVKAKSDAVAAAEGKVRAAQEAALAAEQKHAEDLKEAFRLKDEELKNAVNAERSARMAMLQKIVASVGTLVILGGIGALLFSRGQEPIMAGIAIACGAGMIGFAVLIDQSWFPYVFGALCLTVLIILGAYIWKQRRKVSIAEKTTASVQDLRDAIEEAGPAFWDKLDAAKAEGKTPWDFIAEYFDYRFKDSPQLQTFLDKWMVTRGLNAKPTA